LELLRRQEKKAKSERKFEKGKKKDGQRERERE
jgi:hypothetical protein